MKLRLPYFKQKNELLCGPTSIQMVLSFFGVKKTAENILKKSGVSLSELKKIGLASDKMARLINQYGLHGYAKNQATLKEIKYFIRLGLPTIVNYIEPSSDSGHYAVVVGFSPRSKKIILHDPLNGKNFKILEKEFLKRWRSGYNHYRRWLMVVSKKPLTNKAGILL